MNVVAVVGARLNSSRLPGKQLLDLAGAPLIERIFQRLRHVPEISHIVLATTADQFNAPLVAWARQAGNAVFAFAGDVNDLVARVDAVAEAWQADLLLYVCGDSPLVEPSTISALIRGLMDHPAAELVELAPLPLGKKYIHEGFNVYRRGLWRQIVAASQSVDDKEHLGSALGRFKANLRIQYVADEPVFSVLTHRVSVDTPTDYHFMQEVYRRWYSSHTPDTIVSLPWLIGELKQDERLSAINAEVRQKALGEQSTSILLVCQVGPTVGLGHLMRCLALASALQDGFFANVRLLLQGELQAHERLALLPHRFIAEQDDLAAAIEVEFRHKAFRAVVLDLHPARISENLRDCLSRLGRVGVRRIGVDATYRLAAPEGALDWVCIPAFHVAPEVLSACGTLPVRYGWDYFLLPPSDARSEGDPGNRPAESQRRILVLTGGGDVTGLGRWLPALLDKKLPDGVVLDWVQGPYAEPPALPDRARLTWTVHRAPQSLGGLMARADCALTVYGVSFFELLRTGVPTVVFSPYGEKDRPELAALEREQVALVAETAEVAVERLTELADATSLRVALSRRATSIMDGLGARRLAKDIYGLLGEGA